MSLNRLNAEASSSNTIHSNKKELIRALFRSEPPQHKKTQFAPLTRKIKYIQFESSHIREHSAQRKYEPIVPHKPAHKNHTKAHRNDQIVNMEPKKQRPHIDSKTQPEAIRIQSNNEGQTNQGRPKETGDQRGAKDYREHKEHNKHSRAINTTSSEPQQVKERQTKSLQLIPPNSKSQSCRLPRPTQSNPEHKTADHYHEYSLKTVKKHLCIPQSLPGEKTLSYQGKRVNSHKPSSKSAAAHSSACNVLVKQILNTVGELESTLFENHQHDFNIRMAFGRQTERIHDLRSSLDNEKERNQRLLQLVRGVDSSASSADEAGDFLLRKYNSGQHVQPWQSRTSMDAFESISPLLLQQRFDELTASYKQCRRQLAKKERSLATSKYKNEAVRSKYDDLIEAYRQVQKRFEDLCYKFLRLQTKKNQEIQKLRDVITSATSCIVTAQHLTDKNENRETLHYYYKQFRANLELFVQALEICDWKPHDNYAK